MFMFLLFYKMDILSIRIKKKIRAWNRLERVVGTSSSSDSEDETQTVPSNKDCKENNENSSQMVLRPTTSTNVQPEVEKKKRGAKKK